VPPGSSAYGYRIFRDFHAKFQLGFQDFWDFYGGVWDFCWCRAPRYSAKPVLNSLKDSANTLHDRRYCVVVYGIPENPTGMQRIECLKADLTNTMSVMTQVFYEISSNAISDCYHHD